MPKSLTINYLVPVSNILFRQWLPEELNEAIQVETEVGIVTIQIDRSCVDFEPHEITDEYIAHLKHIEVSKLKVQIVLKDLDDKLCNFIFDECNTSLYKQRSIIYNENEYSSILKTFLELDIKILESIYVVINRFIAYTRNVKGQYWLKEIRLDLRELSRKNNYYKAKAKIDEDNWFTWRLSHTDIITIIEKPSEILFQKQDWKDVRHAMRSGSKSDLVYELAANARTLLLEKHFRNAVIESVTALEIAVSRFAAHPRIDSLHYLVPGRVSLDNLKNRIGHLGISTSIMFLIPLLFNQEALPQRVLDDIFKAIEERNNLVHQGQRSISVDKARQHVNNVLKLCLILIDCTDKEGS
jgi:hypothetical protein